MADERAQRLASRVGGDWLHGVLGDLGPATTANQVLTVFASAARKVGRADFSDDDLGEIQGPDDALVPIGWRSDVAARVAILLTVGEVAGDRLEAIVRAVYREGDSREKAAVVHALCLLPNGKAFLDIALDAGRTNETPLFEALACHNPYPARHYPELELNKLVMKAAFVGARIDYIIGLQRRANPELARMAMEYIDEQESARRRFPPEIWLAIAPHPPIGAIARMLGYLCHSITENRFWAARGLVLAGDPRAATFLRERQRVETDDEVCAEIAGALTSLDSGDRP